MEKCSQKDNGDDNETILVNIRKFLQLIAHFLTFKKTYFRYYLFQVMMALIVQRVSITQQSFVDTLGKSVYSGPCVEYTRLTAIHRWWYYLGDPSPPGYLSIIKSKLKLQNNDIVFFPLKSKDLVKQDAQSTRCNFCNFVSVKHPDINHSSWILTILTTE